MARHNGQLEYCTSLTDDLNKMSCENMLSCNNATSVFWINFRTIVVQFFAKYMIISLNTWLYWQVSHLKTSSTLCFYKLEDGKSITTLDSVTVKHFCNCANVTTKKRHVMGPNTIRNVANNVGRMEPKYNFGWWTCEKHKELIMGLI